MRIIFRFFTIFLLLVTSVQYAQQKESIQEEQLDGKNYFLNSIRVQTTDEIINVFPKTGSPEAYYLKGTKHARYSPSNNYLLISNFNFSTDKADYDITYLLFDKAGDRISEYRDKAPYDLPHKLSAVTDEGIVILFNPLNFEIEIIDKEMRRSLMLEKEMPFEMERASFISAAGNDIYVISSHKPLDLHDTSVNTYIYKVSLVSDTFEKRETSFSVPTALYVSAEGVAAAGAVYTNGAMEHRLNILSENLEVKSSFNIPAEKICSAGGIFYSKYGSTIYKLEGSSSEEFKFDNTGRITDFIADETGISVLVADSESTYFYKLSSGLDVVFYTVLNNVESGNYIKLYSAAGKKIILHSNKTLIIN